MAESFKVEIVTPERLVINDTATELTMPGKGGYLGILPGHAPLITELSVGEISYRSSQQGGKVQRLAVAWGFAEVLPDKVTILAENAERREEIDLARAQRDREEAEAKLKNPPSDTDVSRVEAQLQRANARIMVASRQDADVANLVP